MRQWVPFRRFRARAARPSPLVIGPMGLAAEVVVGPPGNFEQASLHGGRPVHFAVAVGEAVGMAFSCRPGPDSGQRVGPLPPLAAPSHHWVIISNAIFVRMWGGWWRQRPFFTHGCLVL